MSQQVYGSDFSGNAAVSYERYFVPAIGRPVAEDLVEAAALGPGERVLDVACGTGVVTRMAAERVGGDGRVTGSDVNPAMLEVARSSAPPGTSIEWHETSAESMPYEDESFDVVTCQMGLQFIPNKLAALREMRRVLAPAGRAVLNVPGPTPALFSIFADALARNVDPEVASFVHLVFSLHESDELRELMSSAGFREVEVGRACKKLRVPPPKEFMWQYVHATPMAGVLAQVENERRAALEREVCERWEEHVVGGDLRLQVDMTTATGRK